MDVAARGGVHGVAVGRRVLDALRRLERLSGRELRAVGTAYAGNDFRDYDTGADLLVAAVTAPVEAGGTEEKEGSDATGGKNETEGADAPGGLSPYEALYLGLDGDLLRRWAEEAARPLNLAAARALAHSPASPSPMPPPGRWWAGGGWIDGLSGAGGGGRMVVVGYLTSDLKLSHPIGQLLVPILAGHRRQRFTPVCIDSHSIGISRSPLPYQQEVQVVNALGVHVMVNLNGWSGEDRNDVLALRPAPLVINAVGFPGASGCSFIHALLADRVSAPPEMARFFSERLLLLPPSHHPLPQLHLFGAFDPPARVTPPGGVAGISREALGLPPEQGAEGGGVVLASFNRAKKLDAPTWASWLAILQSNALSVLWLSRLALSPAAEQRLLASASAAGVSPDRIIFSDPFPSGEHLAFKSLADLFLDTPGYNAHVTAGDALLAGVPLVVLPRETLASRVSASLAFAPPAPPPPLAPPRGSAGGGGGGGGGGAHPGVVVARNVEDYVALTLALVSLPPLVGVRSEKKRKAVRKALLDARESSPLFDVPLWTRSFEAGLSMALDSLAGLEGSRDGSLAPSLPAHLIVSRPPSSLPSGTQL
ncbi:glycosyl transferase family 41-domain-containing protein [Baffinella frigidus]|nr:glycosyl transferase family 41-domain-containing protein [Cryptophyta sp. CCMP2293]